MVLLLLLLLLLLLVVVVVVKVLGVIILKYITYRLVTVVPLAVHSYLTVHSSLTQSRSQ